MTGAHRRRRLRELVDDVGFWWHSIDLGDGIVTPGTKDPEQLRAEWEALDLPDLDGRTVLDIGTWDGWFAFEAERRGAARVVALDHYVWALDISACQRYWESCRESGEEPERYHRVPGLWHPQELPGKRGFDVAREALGSSVETVVADFESLEARELGTFDVVLFLGVLYHLQDPLRGLRRLAALTEGLAVIETQAVYVPGLEERPLWEFYPGAELEHDVENWWAPNLAALEGACRAGGFDHVETLAGPGEEVRASRDRLVRYRAVVRARKVSAAV